MSRNTFILLGLLAGSVALIGCSKSITAPEPKAAQNDVEAWRGDKVRHDLVDAEIGNEASVKADRRAQTMANQAVPEPKIENELEQPKKGLQGWKGNKLRQNLVDSEIGDGEGITLYNPIRNKLRRMEAEDELGTGDGVRGTVAPAPEPILSDDF